MICFQANLDGKIDRYDEDDEDEIQRRTEAYMARTRVLVNLPRHRRSIIARLFRHCRYLNGKRPADETC